MDSQVKQQDEMVFRSRAHVNPRAAFLTKTYNHLFGAILAFILFEVALFKTGLAAPIATALYSIPWLAVLGIFMLVSWGARSLAYKTESKQSQYIGLALYVVVEGIIFVPLLYAANAFAPGTISSAGLVTLLGFGGLTAIVHFSKKDFSFLGAALKMGGIAALILIVCGAIFGFQLGVFFSVAMVVFASMAILYDTSKIMYEFPENAYVGAALELFASVALLFWYVIQLFMSRD